MRLVAIVCIGVRGVRKIAPIPKVNAVKQSRSLVDLPFTAGEGFCHRIISIPRLHQTCNFTEAAAYNPTRLSTARTKPQNISALPQNKSSRAFAEPFQAPPLIVVGFQPAGIWTLIFSSSYRLFLILA
jgi:hypothetical protein